MIITELDKRWARAELAKAIRQGALVPGPCALCGARLETLGYLADYTAPDRVQWLCRAHKKRVRSLSSLQRQLLWSGLRSFYRREADLACGASAARVGGFRLSSCIESEEPRERARRSAAGRLALERLLKRGLLEHPARGWWRLTRAGVALAKFLHPEVKPNSKRETAANIALRKAVKGLKERPRRRKRRRLRETLPGSTRVLE